MAKNIGIDILSDKIALLRVSDPFENLLGPLTRVADESSQ